ncbi:glucuronate isomerase [Paenibacillus sp.]|uniref:glucuronate isomerase n=1 Tax=Paenibacillus sp. TaxID=58172 RepID=UPI00282DEE53|nr:glucuronate isomerase [Paenibacillus sp.]MDR0266919.1 glucuronate isomerase [Paenibacillus sp.]
MKGLSMENLLLTTESAKRLYHDYAKRMPILDYHNHLNPEAIAANHQFSNITEMWLNGDHYKWRALRWLGVEERLITGDASDKEKFMAWATCVPRMIGNPLFHWTQLELERCFDIQKPLNEHTAEEIWNRCNERLHEPRLRAAGILDAFQVKVACTTDDPVDNLAAHQQIARNPQGTAKVIPAFRPDRALDITHEDFADYIQKLAQSAGLSIHTYNDLLQALQSRIDFFHDQGCRLSDHGFGIFPYKKASEKEASGIFSKALGGGKLSLEEEQKYRTFTLLMLGRMYHARGWAMQLHIGAIRNNNERMFKQLGRDAGYDSILDYHLAAALNGFLSELDRDGQLPKTIVYSLYSSHYEMIATTLGNFQSADAEGKMQLGAAWWFHDQKEGMLKQLTALSSMGLISTFVGMLTDSRSFMSFPRHEYFRRVLCRLLGQWMEEGELPMDYTWIGGTVQDICYTNAERYFQMS